MLLFWCMHLGRLVYLQIFCYGSFAKQAEHQQQREIPLSAKRGVIYDALGTTGNVRSGGFGLRCAYRSEGPATAVSLITRITKIIT